MSIHLLSTSYLVKFDGFDDRGCVRTSAVLPFEFEAHCSCGRWTCFFDGEDAKKGPIVALIAHDEHLRESEKQ